MAKFINWSQVEPGTVFKGKVLSLKMQESKFGPQLQLGILAAKNESFYMPVPAFLDKLLKADAVEPGDRVTLSYKGMETFTKEGENRKAHRFALKVEQRKPLVVEENSEPSMAEDFVDDGKPPWD